MKPRMEGKNFTKRMMNNFVGVCLWFYTTVLLEINKKLHLLGIVCGSITTSIDLVWRGRLDRWKQSGIL